MKPIDKAYIYFLHEEIMVYTYPWYYRCDKEKILREKSAWQKVKLISGTDLKAAGYEISEKDCLNFFCVESNQITETTLLDKAIYNAFICTQ